MRARGINYDTGFLPGGQQSRELFDPATVAREMRVIAEELHCTAVRISGGLPERLTVAGKAAAAAGLEVWFAPFPCEMDTRALRPYFLGCARRAQALRAAGAEVVLVTGCELLLFAEGFLPGADVHARIAGLTSKDPQVWRAMREASGRLNAFLAQVVADAREVFGGRITYASVPFEHIDWTPFDIIGTDAYRSAGNAERFEADLAALTGLGKPVAATEFGCCCYRGAADRGGLGWTIVERGPHPARLDGDYVRDEAEQARYFTQLLEIFERQGVDSAFWFTFAGYGLPHDPHDPRHDLDLASYGVVRMPADAPGRAGTGWERKEVFHAMARAYGG